MSATEHVILVDENDEQTGIAEKIQAHRESLRHRAFSVFVFRQQPRLELLLQQRADNKYHSAGLWTNTCCSHPRPGEDILAAGRRRLEEEMGIRVELASLGWFHYIAQFPNGLAENEIDHVLVGVANLDTITPNANEAKGYRWITVQDLTAEIHHNPDAFTPWLSLALEMIKNNLSEHTAFMREPT